MINREIKFRTWDAIRGKWLSPKETARHLKARDDGRIFAELFDSEGFIANMPVYRFTGLIDRHGTEIYEGDIVKHEDYSSGAQFGKAQPHRLSLVVFHNGGFVLDGYGHIKTHQETHEVIGNIYESGDLLTDNRGEKG